MADTRSTKEFPLTFEKGLVTEVEDSTLEMGQAAALLNWEPAANGVLRSRNAWKTISKTGLTAPYKVRGFGSIATTGASASSTPTPQVIQDSSWPDGADADPVTTRTQTLTGCTIGNIIVAVVSDDSGEIPTIGGTGGFTERAISTGDRQYVKFYTKTAASSTVTFIYTITTSHIRAVTLYEIANLDAEDPGIKWAAASTNTGSGGTNSITATGTDTDGGIALVGYLYNGGTPDSSVGGTAGMTSVVKDNENSRTGVSFEDIDLLDGTSDARTFVTPSWTPPDSGALLVIVGVGETASVITPTISGNNLTWTLQYSYEDKTTYEVDFFVWSADLGQAGKTTDAITIDMGVDYFINAEGYTVSFVRVVGAAPDPIVQVSETNFSSPLTTPTANNVLAALQSGSAVLGLFRSFMSGADPSTDVITASIGAGDWTGVFDAQSTHGVKTILAYQSSTNADTNGGRWSGTASSTLNTSIIMEIAGSGNAAKSSHGVFTAAGTVSDTYTYVANKLIVAKMVVWGYTPPPVSDTSIQFYIVMALSTDSTTYKIYRILRDEITSGTWSQIDVVTDAQATDAWVTFAQGAGKMVWSSSTLASPRAITLNPLGASGITDMLDKAGRSAAYHKDRMFIGGSQDVPGRLYFSAIGDPTSFTTATDFLDIGGDDGEAIQDLVSVEGLLMVCKNNRLYLISGSGIESFFVNELPGGTAAAGKPAIRTPYGTIVAGPDDIWVVQGGGVDPMSRPLGGGYSIPGNVSTAYAQDSVLITDAVGGKVFRVNLVTGAWSEETVKANAPYINFSLNGRLYYGVNDSSVQVGGKRQLTDGRNFDLTTDGNSFDASTGKLSLVGPSSKYSPIHLYLQLRNQVPTTPNTLHIRITSNVGDEDQSREVTDAVQRERIDLGKHKGAEWLQVSFAADSSAQHGAIDVEKAVLKVIVEEGR